jgi:hypothetical protein
MGSNAVLKKALKSALTFPGIPLHFRESRPLERPNGFPVIMGIRGGGLLIHPDVRPGRLSILLLVFETL